MYIMTNDGKAASYIQINIYDNLFSIFHIQLYCANSTLFKHCGIQNTSMVKSVIYT